MATHISLMGEKAAVLRKLQTIIIFIKQKTKHLMVILPQMEI
jgi:hypothetical protein